MQSSVWKTIYVLVTVGGTRVCSRFKIYTVRSKIISVQNKSWISTFFPLNELWHPMLFNSKWKLHMLAFHATSLLTQTRPSFLPKSILRLDMALGTDQQCWTSWRLQEESSKMVLRSILKHFIVILGYVCFSPSKCVLASNAHETLLGS